MFHVHCRLSLSIFTVVDTSTADAICTHLRVHVPKLETMTAEHSEHDVPHHEGHSFGIDVGGSGIKGAEVDLATGEFVGDRLKIATPKPATPPEPKKEETPPAPAPAPLRVIQSAGHAKRADGEIRESPAPRRRSPSIRPSDSSRDEKYAEQDKKK